MIFDPQIFLKLHVFIYTYRETIAHNDFSRTLFWGTILQVGDLLPSQSIAVLRVLLRVSFAKSPLWFGLNSWYLMDISWSYLVRCYQIYFDNTHDVRILIIRAINPIAAYFPLRAITCLFPMSPIPPPLGSRTTPQPKFQQRAPQSIPNLRGILFLCYFNLWKFAVSNFIIVYSWVVSLTTSTADKFTFSFPRYANIQRTMVT